jgi:hypothetical protein
MSSDLEHDIRRALHDRVEHVTPDRLRPVDPAHTAPRRPLRTRWAVAGPIAAAACVAVIAVAITVAVSGDDPKGSPAGGRGNTVKALIGTSWALTSVRPSGHATIPIPQRLSASITFERGSGFDAQDGINAYRATYEFTAAGELVISGAGGTAVGYGGHDPATLVAARALHAVLYASSGRTTPHLVGVQHRPGRLELAAGGYTLFLTGEVRVATSSPPPPSSTRSR